MGYIHSARIGGIENLFSDFEKRNKTHLCCSSTDCQGFLARDVLMIVEGKAVREYSGDVGWIGGSARNTAWDEIHVENFEVVGIDERTSEFYGQWACFILEEIMEINLSNLEIPEKFKNNEWIYDLGEEDYEDELEKIMQG